MMEKTMFKTLVTLLVITWVRERQRELADDVMFVEQMTETFMSFERKHIMNVLTVKTVEETLDYLMDQAFAETRSDAKLHGFWEVTG